MTDSLNDRVARLRQTRVSLRKAVEAAKLIGDRCDREKRIHDLTITLRSTEPEWRSLQAELEARSDRIAVAQLRHTRTVAVPARRSVAGVGYVTKVMVPNR